MVLLVFLLICSCLGCLREGMWTHYTPADVARWQAHQMVEKPSPRLPSPTLRLDAPRLARSLSGPAEGIALRREASPTPHST